MSSKNEVSISMKETCSGSVQFYVPSACSKSLGLKPGNKVYLTRDAYSVRITPTAPTGKSQSTIVDQRGNIRILQSKLHRSKVNVQLIVSTGKYVDVSPIDSIPLLQTN